MYSQALVIRSYFSPLRGFGPSLRCTPNASPGKQIKAQLKQTLRHLHAWRCASVLSFAFLFSFIRFDSMGSVLPSSDSDKNDGVAHSSIDFWTFKSIYAFPAFVSGSVQVAASCCSSSAKELDYHCLSHGITSQL